MVKKILIMNDGVYDEDVYCLENGDRLSAGDLVELLMLPHTDAYESVVAYFPQVEERFAKENSEFDANEVSDYIYRMYSIIMYNSIRDFEVYSEAFEEMWELAQSC